MLACVLFAGDCDASLPRFVVRECTSSSRRSVTVSGRQTLRNISKESLSIYAGLNSKLYRKSVAMKS